MTSYQYKKSHCGNKTVVRSSHLHNGISYTGKMSSLYRIGALVFSTSWSNVDTCAILYRHHSFSYLPSKINLTRFKRIAIYHKSDVKRRNIPGWSVSVHRVETVKQSGLWSGLSIWRLIVKQSGPWGSLDSHGCNAFLLIGSLFDLAKLGIIEIALFKLNLALDIKVTPLPTPKV